MIKSGINTLFKNWVVVLLLGLIDNSEGITANTRMKKSKAVMIDYF